jgi:hypothetical protein
MMGDARLIFNSLIVDPSGVLPVSVSAFRID